MKIRNLVYKEIKRRKLNFLLGLLSVAFAVSMLTGTLTMLQIHDIKTIHSLLFKWFDAISSGQFRSGDIMINQAKLQPVYGVLVEESMRFFVDYTNKVFDQEDIFI